MRSALIFVNFSPASGGPKGGTSRSEGVTVLGARRVPPLLENLQQGLDQPIDDTWHAELSDPALRLGYLDPLDRLRLVSSLEQMGPNVWPALTPRSFEISSVAHLLYQLFCASRAFGCW